MKNFNKHSSNGHHVSKRRKLAQYPQPRGLHTYINTVTTTYEAPAQLLQNLEKKNILKVPEGGGANRSTQRKTLTACLLIGITY